MNQDYFEPKKVPLEVRRYLGKTRQLAVGSPGKLGGLKLEFESDSTGRTVLGKVWKQIPLQVLKPFYYDENQPKMPIMYLLNPTGGVLQGDRLRIDVSIAANCRVLLTTPAATKIYGMDSNYATQTVNLELGRSSYLEYLPDQVIPYRGSRYCQEINVRMRPGASFVSWEILTGGRTGRERFDFDIFHSSLRVVDQGGVPLLTDTIVLEPRVSRIEVPGSMGDFLVLGNFYVVTDRETGDLVGKVDSTLKASDILAGVGPLSMSGGLIARAVGPSTRLVRGILEKVWNEVRTEVLGSPAPQLRK